MTEAGEILPTRAALRELFDEIGAIREGRQDLDHKRQLLAAEMLRLLAEHQAHDRIRSRELEAARKAMAESLAIHGLDAILAAPTSATTADRDDVASPRIRSRVRSYLGVPLIEASLEPAASSTGALPTPELRRCRAAFERVLRGDAVLAALGCSLRRLQREYRRTERRARTLEDLIEPELAAVARHLEDALDDQDQEESMIARHSTRRDRDTR